MSAKQSDNPETPVDDERPKTWKDALPFIIALVVVVIAVGAIFISHKVQPSEDRVSDSTKVQYVVNDMYSARNSLNYELYRSSQCEKNLSAEGFPTAAQFAEANRDPRDGAFVIPEMDVEVAGDRAAVTVHEKRKNTGDKVTKTELTVVKIGDDWKVCAA
ncbi:hypothetical protein nbrc107696_04720 [Gordonia spumicola]|uniref:DUF4878 domain-containing protein n=1 Tax=Gordonia spumicola TaxID=589161 RepID=A0A7I9V3N6_9ACTN|nr:hypothetical protein [Gordonia spumicola]GEE00026.1 hypothetical protein nbrc107696_04720 [Gordonia spumicola]